MEVNCGWNGKRMNDKHIYSPVPDGVLYLYPAISSHNKNESKNMSIIESHGLKMPRNKIFLCSSADGIKTKHLTTEYSSNVVSVLHEVTSSHDSIAVY
jgi:hypothetical protein